ncbi:MAG: ABC transporter permease [Thermomicrobiales bacterium]|nr:ABC transporter permease [Thermomicrobiales bacterium]
MTETRRAAAPALAEASPEPHQPSAAAVSLTDAHPASGLYRRAWRRFRRDKVAMFGLILTVLIVLFVLSADLISRITGFDYRTGELGQQFLPPFQGPHILGTDLNGRDVLVRLAYGGRVSLFVAVLAALTTLVIGGGVGAISGFFGGWADGVLMRLVDVLLSVPGLPILLLISVLYRPGVTGLAVIIALLSWPGVARLIRGEVLGRRGAEYVEAARVAGADSSRIILRHIIPNVIPLMVVWISLAIPALILTEATLSFLGFGVRVPVPSWGNMLDGATKYFAKSWTNVFIPGFAIWLTVLAINLIGNGLRDALDPRLND